MSRQPLRSICWRFLGSGAGAFGGGMAALPVFEAELATRRRWLTPHDVAEAYAISQSVPGVIIVNFAVLTGLRFGGKRGALVAAIAVALPAYFIILALAALFAGRWENRWVAAALSGLRPAVVAVVAGAALRLGRSQLRSPFAWLAAAVGAALLFAKILPPIPLILLGAAAGLALHFARRKGAASP